MKDAKISIIGAGNVGSTLAYILAINNICTNVILKDIRESYAKAIALDISQSASAVNSSTIIEAAKSAEDLKNSNIVIITAGVPRKQGMSRDDLLLINAKIIKSVTEEIKLNCPNAIVIVVSNPLDAMVYAALKLSNFKREQIIGMAGILDSARMSYFIHKTLGYGAGRITSYVMGGHGDDMVPLINHSKLDHKNICEFLSEKQIEEVIQKTKNGGLEIVKLLETGSAYYAPAYSIYIMIKAIIENSKEIHSCSIMLQGEYGYSNVVAGVPVQLGLNGLSKIIEFDLTQEQKKLFSESIYRVNDLIDVLNNKFFV